MLSQLGIKHSMCLAARRSASINGFSLNIFFDERSQTFSSDCLQYDSPSITHLVLSTHTPICPYRAASVLSTVEVSYQSLAEWIYSLVSASNGQLFLCDSTWRLLVSLEMMASDCVELVGLIWALHLKTGLQDKVSWLKTVSWWSTCIHLVFHGSRLALEWVFTLNGNAEQD